MRLEQPRDPRAAAIELLSRIMPLPGRQDGDARLLLELERKTRDGQ